MAKFHPRSGVGCVEFSSMYEFWQIPEIVQRGLHAGHGHFVLNANAVLSIDADGYGCTPVGYLTDHKSVQLTPWTGIHYRVRNPSTGEYLRVHSSAVKFTHNELVHCTCGTVLTLVGKDEFDAHYKGHAHA